MKSFRSITDKLILFICMLYALLFVYAAVSKLLDFENFRVQLGQSPLLSAFAGFISVAVLLVEIVVALMLVHPKLRRLGLYAAFSLMAMFTAYIYIILNYSEFVPCSCGGILEKMGWHEHLTFNIAFMIMAAVAIMLVPGRLVKIDLIYRSTAILVTWMLSTLIVVFLYVRSESTMQYHNNFTRRFIPLSATKDKAYDLKFNSYYFAGAWKEKIYLGNHTAPLTVTVLDTALKTKTAFRVLLDRKDLPFRSVKVSIAPPYFFVTDGTVPCIYRGNISDWKARFRMQTPATFSLAQPLDSLHVALRAHLAGGQSIMALADIAGTGRITFNKELLQKQKDGVFDTDGSLSFDEENKMLVYVYRYRNQFIAADNKLKVLSRGNTIDTVSKAILKMADIESSGSRKFAAPPLIVNHTSAAKGGHLFVHASLPGQYESLSMWKTASIIDVYNTTGNRYQGSFYIYNEKGGKMKSFTVYGQHLFAFIGDQLVRYKLSAAFAGDSGT